MKSRPQNPSFPKQEISRLEAPAAEARKVPTLNLNVGARSGKRGVRIRKARIFQGRSAKSKEREAGFREAGIQEPSGKFPNQTPSRQSENPEAGPKGKSQTGHNPKLSFHFEAANFSPTQSPTTARPKLFVLRGMLNASERHLGRKKRNLNREAVSLALKPRAGERERRKGTRAKSQAGNRPPTQPDFRRQSLQGFSNGKFPDSKFLRLKQSFEAKRSGKRKFWGIFEAELF